MYCPKCGQINEDNADFCVFCGQRVGTAIASQLKVVRRSTTEELSNIVPQDTEFEEDFNRILLDRYKLIKELGSGGMGKVYLAEDTKMEYPIVVKEMLPYLIAPKERKYIEEHFKEEAKMLYRLKNMGLPRVTDFFFEGASIYIIMEYIEGEDLESIIKKRPENRINIEEFFTWMYELLKILKYLHNQDPPIIHRDIKPGNIMLTNDNKIILVDFGVARTIAAKTGTQTRVGTPGFASPEHFFGKFILSSDLYSLGATFHYLISGDDPRTRNPFDYPPLNSYRDDIPKGLQKILDKMLDPEPDRRYNNVESLEKDLLNLSRMLTARGIIKTGPLTQVGSGFSTEDLANMSKSIDGTSLLNIPKGPINWKKVTDAIFESSVCALAFSPDGNYLACGTGGNNIQLIDSTSTEFLKNFSGHTDWVRALSYSPDGKYIASGSDDKFIRIWNVETGKEYKQIYGHQDWIRSIKYSPDGAFIVSGSYDGNVKIWSTRSWSCSIQISPLEEAVNCVDYSPTGKAIAAGCDDCNIYVWSARTGKLARTLEGHESYVYSTVFSPDGNFIASGSGDKTIKIWNLNTGKCLRTFKGHDDSIFTIAFSPDGNRVATSGDDMKIRIWNIGTGRCENLLKGHSKPVYSLAYSPLGNLLVSGAGDKTVIFWGY